MHVKANGVEIRDWTRVMGRRLSLLVVIPVAAMLVAGILAVLEPQTYRATATVILPNQETSGPVSSAVTQFVSDFEGAITSDSVAQATSEATDEPKSAVNAGITTKREGSSGVVEVTYTGTNGDRVGPVAVTASRLALAQIAQIQLDVIQAQLDAAQQQYDDAIAHQQEVAAASGIADLHVVQSQFQKRLTAALDALNNAKANGTQQQITAAQAHFDDLSSRYTKLLSDYQAATLAVTASQNSVIFLRGEVAQSQGIVKQAQENDRIKASPPRPTSRLTFIVRRMLFAGAFGLLMAIAVIILMEFLRPSPLNRIRHEASLPTEPGSRRTAAAAAAAARHSGG